MKSPISCNHANRPTRGVRFKRCDPIQTYVLPPPLICKFVKTPAHLSHTKLSNHYSPIDLDRSILKKGQRGPLGITTF
jgi:hypothetical protein